MFGLGLWELLIVLAVVLLLFGAGRLPKVMSDMGKGVTSFKKALNEGETTEKEEKKKAE